MIVYKYIYSIFIILIFFKLYAGVSYAQQSENAENISPQNLVPEIENVNSIKPYDKQRIVKTSVVFRFRLNIAMIPSNHLTCA